jgi:hypothetical protein
MKNPRRIKAVQRWAQLAAGNPDPETLAWVAGVARKVLEANALPAADRRKVMVEAVGLGGTDGAEAEAIRQLQAYVATAVLGSGVRVERRRREMLRPLVRFVCAVPDSSDDAIDERIRRASR